MNINKILVVDDNDHLLEYLKVFLQKKGYEVRTAASGLTAIEDLTEYPVELVFVDFFLPHINADRLCHIVRKMEHLKNTRIVVMSAAATELGLSPEEIGADGIIAKGSFKETAQCLIDSIENIEKYRDQYAHENILGVDSINPRRMTKELLEQNKHLQAMMDSISEGIIEVYKDKIVYANIASSQILKSPLSQILSKTFPDIFNGQTGSRIKKVLESAHDKKNTHEKKEIIDLDGKKICIKPFPLENEPDTVIILMTDMTDLLKTEAELKNYQQHLEDLVEERTKDRKIANKKLRHAQKMEAIGTIAGGVAHDLNNILSGIVSYPDLLLLEIPDDSPLEDPLKTIKKSGQKAAEVVKDLLALARRGLVTKDEIHSLNDIIKEYLSSPEHDKLLFYHKRLKVKYNLADDLLSVKCSFTHFSKVLMNLVTNSAEAVPEGGEIIITTKNVCLYEDINLYEQIPKGEYVTLEVEDTGKGISDADLNKIFEPFYTKKILGRSGTGLGMTVVWGTVKDYNGYINIKSKKDIGTKIQLYFPAAREAVESVKTHYDIKDYIGKNESVLIVDDESDQRKIASKILKKLNYKVYSVKSGEEAITFIRQNSVDIIILDMIMEPGIDGLETYLKIKKFKPGQKAIIASGFAESNTIKELLKTGVGQYVSKPYTVQGIGLALRKELESNKTPHQER